MDGEDDDFLSGRHSDDGGGTPVQDEHGEQAGHRSEDEGSGHDDSPVAMETSGAAGGSEEERAGSDSDSGAEAPGGHRDNDKTSNLEAEPSQPAESEEEEEGGSSPPKRRGSSSDVEGGGHMAPAGSGSENEDAKPAVSPGSDSEDETPARRKAVHIDSEEEEGGGGGKWKAVMQSDSEEEEEGRGRRKAAAGSEGEKEQKDEDDEKPVKRKKAVLSDSEEEDDDEEHTDKPAPKRTRVVSDDSDGGALPLRPDSALAAKLRELGSDSGSDEDERMKSGGKKEEEEKGEKALFGSDSDSGEEEEEEEEKMIADIFGESGDEEEEFTGFNQEDLEGDKKEAKGQQEQQQEESDSDDGVDRSGQDTSFMSDFDVMLARRKAMNSRKRRHRDGGTFISDADDVVSAMISKMNEAAEEDRTLNSQKKPALKKLTLLPHVVMHLKKQDLKETFIDSGVMSAIKEWISPLPDKSLPALRIREELLRILQELPSVSQETLKHSGIGRSVMFLYKHPKESRANKDLALKLINEWSRPIFGLTSNYKGMTREERQQRDLDQQMPQKQRLSQPPEVGGAKDPDVFSPPISSGGQTPRRDLEKQLTGEEKALRPGDPGFCARARVPMPSNKDYVVRPKWNVEMESNRHGPMKKGMTRVDKQMRRFADIRRLTKPGHAVKISVEGNRMPL
ncbi:protein IWS1 homolog isoform X1 [Pungitius pungitius]|uniref:protein IWS1 homolog isoform X1 n=1 Tax=Pungitius pungitius TaxID=134920 RepID=UPI002E0DA666